MTKLSRNAPPAVVILGTPGGTDCQLMSPSLAELSCPDMIGSLADNPTSPKRARLAQWRCGATKARCRADAPGWSKLDDRNGSNISA